MFRTPTAGRLEIRVWILPALQALFTFLSTTAGVLLVILWRPNRARPFPFYSDATHHDPERIILAIGENLACFFLPLVALAEYLQQSRLATVHPTAALGKWARRVWPGWRCMTRDVAVANFVCSWLTTVFFFMTANLPSTGLWIPPHQFAASMLILMYAVQGSLRAVLAVTFGNYEVGIGGRGDVEEGGVGTEKGVVKEGGGKGGWWRRHHVKVRVVVAGYLWWSLVLTWVCYVGRLVTRKWGAGWQGFRYVLVVMMTLNVYVTTVGCVGLMGMSAVDLRHEVVVLAGR